MDMNHVLIVEDDTEIREGVTIYLKSQGYEVFQASDGIEGLEILQKEEIHLAIIDIMMPRMDGIRMTMKLREKYYFPVIMLSAKSEEVDKITGLNIGADDYVTKPFTPMELMARVNSQIRRYRKFMEKLEIKENIHIIGGLEINEDTVEVFVDGLPIQLTPTEYRILLLLAKNPGRVFSVLKRQYDALLHLDFQDKTNRTIFRIVGINFVIVFLISLFGVTGIWAFALYSVVLFVFLRRYFRKIQEQYKGILKATRALAKGKLDEPLTEDVGIFAPVQEELRRIQHGFQKAVKEEVKSERTKTELITNVSHDLKTPLTAIITYIDLVRTEQDEAKRNEYIDVLERKSLRLKVLIEDLFEISKATSRSATLQYMKIDIVDLLKQVCLEYESDLQKAELEMRFRLPDAKIIVWLDSQKTYRIFENLIVNISKYSMPHTRVYISMTESEDNVRIVMKNISQEEITFDTEEITDRFVRGDASRNTEGSGLGLAIAKSFVELQHGSLRISAEADLFKAEITLPKTDPSSLLEKKA